VRRPSSPLIVAAAAAVALAVALGSMVSGTTLAGRLAPSTGSLRNAAVAVGGPINPAPPMRAYLSPTNPYAGPTPDRACDAGSRPETVQGKAPAADYKNGRAAKGYFCNARELSHYGHTGGYRVERYVDAAGHECAFWDSTLLWPHNIPDQGTEGPGVYVMNMHNPKHPVVSDVLRTPAMQSPHESLRLNQKRGLLVADMGYPTWNPGFVDVYSVKQDCLHPTLDSSSPMGVLGHEGGFAPDGKTFYVASLYAHTLSAVDLSNPQAPVLLWTSTDYQPHGVSISNDGNRLYMAEAAYQQGTYDSGFHGLTILDVSQIQKRVMNPQVSVVSRLTWPQVSTPQNATPFVSHAHHYLLETDEFGSGKQVGAARIIDIDNEKHPYVVSNLRLAVNKGGQTADPGDDQVFQGYQAHYCSLPSRVDPYIIACSFIMSGLRVFDIRNVAHPVEVAYFNKPLLPNHDPVYPMKVGSFAMSAPAYDQARHDIWYDDGNSGFYVVHLTRGSGVTKFAARIVYPGN